MDNHRSLQGHDSSCCSGGAGGRSWGVAEGLEELDFRKSLAGAALSNDISRMRQLLSRGVAADITDANGYTPLHYAARNGHLDACLLLLQNGAQVDKCTRAGKATSLHRAAYAGHVEIVKALIRAGADVLRQDADGLRPVDRAGHI
ncbi:hypothetical protein KP509_02G098000 [Ceratopteris richardii]|uniref:Ankyrin repeat domain-containing protein 39 n=1 Tax=Ceratopteris richardii TaxID=49495 RepID=A0A8T2V8Z8_CERRI|nr:hypothetical protein KP509_02G098000 [Ceratopteris richardii]